jgi:hypothetical protein
LNKTTMLLFLPICCGKHSPNAKATGQTQKVCNRTADTSTVLIGGRAVQSFGQPVDAHVLMQTATCDVAA